jgi:hypothetical protein
MPSPFGQFKEQQVKPVDILPYTQGIADSLATGIKNLGQGVVEGYVQYKKEQKDKETVLPLAIDEVNKYIRKDDKGKESLDDTAPTYIKDFYTASKNEGLEDGWKAGAGRVATSTVGTFWATHNEALKQKEFEFKLKVQEGLAQKAKAEVDALNFNSELTGEEVPTTETNVYNKPVKTAQLYNPNTGGTTNIASVDQVIEEAGITDPTKIWTQEQWGKFVSENTIGSDTKLGISLTGNASFNVDKKFENLPADRDSEGRTMPYKLINGVYTELANQGYPLKKGDKFKDGKVAREGLDDIFKKGSKNGTGYSSEVNITPETYAKAIKLLKQPEFQRAFTDKGLDLTEQMMPVPKDVWVKYDTGDQKNQVTETRNLNELEVINSKYDAVARRWAQYNPNAFIPSRQVIQQLNLGAMITTVTDTLGRKLVQVGSGANTRLIPLDTYNKAVSSGKPIGTGDGEKMTAVEKEVKEQNAYLGGFTGKGKRFGSMTLIYDTDVETGLPKTWGGKWDIDYKPLAKGIQALERVNTITDKMLALTKDSAGKKLFSIAWNKEYDNLNLQLQTLRTEFIAPGQETDRDNDRLLTITGNQDWFLKLNPDVAVKIIAGIRAIANDKVAGAWTSGGGRIKHEGSDLTAQQARAYLDSVIAENGLKPPKKETAPTKK